MGTNAKYRHSVGPMPIIPISAASAAAVRTRRSYLAALLVFGLGAGLMVLGMAAETARAQSVDASQPGNSAQDARIAPRLAPPSSYTPPEPGPVMTRAQFDQIQSLRSERRYKDAAAAASPLAASNDPDTLYLLGSVAQEAGDYELAGAAYERAVMIQPDFAGAWLDLAVVTRANGDDATAQALFDYVVQEFSPPAPLMARIAVLRRQTIAPALAAVTPASGGWHGELRAQYGHDSNANNGIALTSLPLVAGAGIVVDIPIAEEERARDDTAMQASALLRYGHAFNDRGDRRGEVLVALTQRGNHDLNDYDTRDLLVGGSLIQDTAVGSISQRVAVQQIRLGGQDLLYAGRAGLGWERQYGACRIGVGGELEQRHYSSLSNLDARIVWLQGGGGCLARIGSTPVQAAVLLRHGQDSAVHDRAGGDARRYEMTTVLAAELRPRVVLEGLFALSQTHDSNLYSAILADNAVRRTTRTQARLQLQFPLLGPVDGFVSIERLKQSSNIALFEQSGRTIWAGIRYGF
jgi:tetratricopeptide (TPR) repeat protein